MKIAVVTGASSGIGREFVYAVDKKYSFDEIWVIARRAERLEELKEKCRNPIRPVALDLAADADLKAYAELLEKEKPEIALLVNAAGCGYVLSLSRAIGRELRPRGVHVMCVCPGWIKTEFQQHAKHDEYIRYVDRWYGPEEVAAQAMKDLEKKKTVSILGAPVRRQVALVKHLPVDMVMDIWCKQQGFE